MRATNRKNMHTNEFSPLAVKPIRNVRHVCSAARRSLSLASFLTLSLLFCTLACAPDSTGGGGQNGAASPANGSPEITDEIIRQELNDAYVRKVPEENGAGEPISWRFDDEEPKEYNVTDKQINGERATLILDIKTRSAPDARTPRQLAGQVRTEWKLQTGWALRTWEIVEAENVSLKYKNLPKPPAPNAAR